MTRTQEGVLSLLLCLLYVNHPQFFSLKLHVILEKNDDTFHTGVLGSLVYSLAHLKELFILQKKKHFPPSLLCSWRFLSGRTVLTLGRHRCPQTPSYTEGVWKCCHVKRQERTVCFQVLDVEVEALLWVLLSSDILCAFHYPVFMQEDKDQKTLAKFLQYGSVHWDLSQTGT